MTALTLGILADRTGGTATVCQQLTQCLGRPSIDSRSVGEGETFFAIKGPRFDGHAFVSKAIEMGATTIVVQRGAIPSLDQQDVPAHVNILAVDDPVAALQSMGRWYREVFRGDVIGITGSSGKTTTKEMLRTALGAHGNVVATKGNLNNHLGVPLSLSQLSRDAEFGVFEMGMNAPGEIRELSRWVKADVAMITSIGEAHLEGVGSLEGVARAKGELFETLASDGIAICPEEVPFIEHLRAIAAERLWTVGHTDSNQCRILEVSAVDNTTHVAFSVDGLGYDLCLPFVGHHLVSNALCALLAVHALKLPLSPSIDALESFELPSMRGQTFTLSCGTRVILDCYNANPQSMRAAIDAHQMFGAQRHLLILGDMRELGAHSERAHTDLGAFIARNYPTVDVVAVGPQMAYMAHELKSNEHFHGSLDWFSSTTDAVSALPLTISNYDNVLIKGSRGLELETIWDRIRE